MSGPNFTPPFKTLVDGVRAYFLAHKIATSVDRGWKARDSQINQGPGGANRVVFMGSKPDGSCGRIVPPRQAGDRELGADPTTDPPTPAKWRFRPLCDWQRTVYVSIWAYDADASNDDGAQDDALYQLFVLTMRAVNSVAFGNAVWGTTQIQPPGTRPFGVELLVDLTFQHAMPDLPEELVNPSAKVNPPPP